MTRDSQRARKDEKSSHRARDVLPRECCSWPSYLQMSMDPFGGRKTTCRYQKNMMPTIQGQLQFQHVALLSLLSMMSHEELALQSYHMIRGMGVTCRHVHTPRYVQSC